MALSAFILAVCIAILVVTSAAANEGMPDNMPGMPGMTPAPAPKASGSTLASFSSALAMVLASVVSFMIFK